MFWQNIYAFKSWAASIWCLKFASLVGSSLQHGKICQGNASFIKCEAEIRPGKSKVHNVWEHVHVGVNGRTWNLREDIRLVNPQCWQGRQTGLQWFKLAGQPTRLERREDRTLVIFGDTFVYLIKVYYKSSLENISSWFKKIFPITGQDLQP